jgi:indole-3-glycerol phosphate synthase
MIPRILHEIVAHKRMEVAAAKKARPLHEVEAEASVAPEPLDFAAALVHGPHITLIAEVKRRSPSAGALRTPFRPVQIARTYEAHGAAAISVVTDTKFFGGTLDDLRRVRAAVGIPVLRKDFLIDPYQVFETRAAGADAALLISEILPPKLLSEMLAVATDIGLECLVECHCVAALRKVVESGAEIIGINNRDLHTFTASLETTRRLAKRVPPGRIIVSESALSTRADVERVASWGAHAVLVGESLLRQRQIGPAVDALLGR